MRFLEYIPASVQRYWLTIAFFVGFFVDTITLNSVEQLFDNIILAFYVCLAMVSIAALYAGVAGRLGPRLSPKIRRFAPLMVQFALGGLLSGMLIFYSRSGSWWESWPFLLLIIAVIYGNETLEKRSDRLVFNLAVMFVGLFSYLVLIVPVLTGWLGAWVFVVSGLLALVIMVAYVELLRTYIPRYIELSQRSLVFVIGSIFVLLNTLYFTNAIPPIPLSLKEASIVQSVIRYENGDYELTYEPAPWWQFWNTEQSTFYPSRTNSVYCFTRVFAPTRINTDIYHRWEYKTTNGEWREYYRMSYPITGGSDVGYRGYTLLQNFQDGRWRCSVETGRGQVLGRETFTIDTSRPPAELETRIE